MLTVLTNLTLDVYMWTCTIWMTLFAASRKLRGDCEQVFINQLNFRPTSIGKHNSMGHLLPCAIDFKTNHPPIHLQWIGILWHGNWAAPCYFNGASPTGSARWGYCLQRHLACEGLYRWIGQRQLWCGLVWLILDVWQCSPTCRTQIVDLYHGNQRCPTTVAIHSHHPPCSRNSPTPAKITW